VNRNNGPFKRPLGRWARGKKFSYRYGTYIWFFLFFLKTWPQ
jgi:hypothetical protein